MMHEWEYSASGLMRMAGDADCVCAVCDAVEGHHHEPTCPIGLARADWNCLENESIQLRADLARVTAERDRLRAALENFAERGCSYGDGCPTFGTRHGQCTGCNAREALRAVE